MAKVYIGYPKEMNLVMEGVKDKLVSIGIVEDLGPRGFVVHTCTIKPNELVNLLRDAQGLSVVFAADIEDDVWHVMLNQSNGIDTSIQGIKAKTLF